MPRIRMNRTTIFGNIRALSSPSLTERGRKKEIPPSPPFLRFSQPGCPERTRLASGTESSYFRARDLWGKKIGENKKSPEHFIRAFVARPRVECWRRSQHSDNFWMIKSSSELGTYSLYFKIKSIVLLTDKFFSLRSKIFASDLVLFSHFQTSIQGKPDCVAFS